MGEMIPSYDNTKLYLNKETDMDCRAVAVIVHGLCEHQGRYDYFSGLFHKAGIGTYRFDHRGHGRSEGERTYYTDFNELLDDTNVVVDLAIAENPGVFCTEIPSFTARNGVFSRFCASRGVLLFAELRLFSRAVNSN